MLAPFQTQLKLTSDLTSLPIKMSSFLIFSGAIYDFLYTEIKSDLDLKLSYLHMITAVLRISFLYYYVYS